MWFWLTLGVVVVACLVVAAIYDRRQRRRGGYLHTGGDLQRGLDRRPPPTDPGGPPGA
jgi:hypothetical protein